MCMCARIHMHRHPPTTKRSAAVAAAAREAASAMGPVCAAAVMAKVKESLRAAAESRPLTTEPREGERESAAAI